MEEYIPEFKQREKTDRHLSFFVYILVMLGLVGVILILAVLLGVHMSRFFSTMMIGLRFIPQALPFHHRYFFLFTGWILILMVILLALSVIFWWYQWQLYKRRNLHFRRAKGLKNSLSRWVKEKYGIELSYLRGNEIHLSLREEERGTVFFVLWVIFTYVFGIIGFVLTLVAWYWLTADWFVHERGEEKFFNELSEALKDKGILFNAKIQTPVPPRSMILYIILMIIPGVNLIWSIWWSYVLFRDPNVHFDTHLFWETQLERIAGQKTSSPTDSPLEILKRRYAEGKITREEFEQMKKDLLAD